VNQLQILRHRISLLSLKPVNATSLLDHPVVGELEKHLREAGYDVVKVSTLRSFTRRTIRTYIKELPNRTALIVDGLFFYGFGAKHRVAIESAIKDKDVYVYILTSIPHQLLNGFNVLYTEYTDSEAAEMIQYNGAGAGVNEEMLRALDPFMRRRPKCVIVLTGMHQVAEELGRELSKRYGYRLILASKPIADFEPEENTIISGVFHPLVLLHRSSLVVLAKVRPKQAEVLEVLFRASRFSVPVVSLYTVFRTKQGKQVTPPVVADRSPKGTVEYAAGGVEKVVIMASGKVSIHPVTVAITAKPAGVPQAVAKPPVEEVVSRYIVSEGAMRKSVVEEVAEVLRKYGYDLPHEQIINTLLNVAEKIVDTASTYTTLERVFRALVELEKTEAYRDRAMGIIQKLIQRYSQIGPRAYLVVDCEKRSVRYVSNTASVVYSYLLRLAENDLDRLCRERPNTHHGLRIEYRDELKKLEEQKCADMVTMIVQKIGVLNKRILKAVNRARSFCLIPEDDLRYICGSPLTIGIIELRQTTRTNCVAELRMAVSVEKGKKIKRIDIGVPMPVDTLYRLATRPKAWISDLLDEIGEAILDKIVEALAAERDKEQK